MNLNSIITQHFKTDRPNRTNKFILTFQFLYVFRHHLFSPHDSPDDGLHFVSGIIKTCVRVTVTLNPYL